MTSKTSICNKALRKIGVANVINIDTDEGKPASTCKSVYDDLLLEVLREYNWNFAIFRQELNQDTTTPAFEYAYRYILPTVPQLVKLIEVYQSTAYKIENGYLLSDETTVKIKYVGKETNPNKYDALFVDLFATRIGAEVAYILTGDKGLGDKLAQEYLFKLSNAKDKDFQEDNSTPLEGSAYNDARRSYFSNDISQLVE
tara:strand:+ start:621 stop:1220 length:600 start_codon:yes stop_codon:yes gene_type:complete